MNKRFVRSAILVAILSALGASRVALAVNEIEPNDPVANAQKLTIGSDGTATVNGAILNTQTHRDVDFYSFQANKGDVLTVNIDGGMNASDTQGVWTTLAVFGPGSDGPLSLLRKSISGNPIDRPGSVSIYDARIDKFLVPETGTYVVGVSSDPGFWVDVNSIAYGALYWDSPFMNIPGTYTLIISGVSPSVEQIGIEIQPGRHNVLWVYAPSQTVDRDHDRDRDHELEVFGDRHFREGIPVALLSSATFSALDVDETTLKFGHAGNEASFIRCRRHAHDVNGDKLPDLTCYFDFRKANFQVGDTEGIVTGMTKSGQAFEGRGALKIMTGRPRHLDHDRD